MPNADNTYGTFNKMTKILSQLETPPRNFANVDEAKAYFLSSEALTVFDECCTELQWAVVDNQKLKYTMTFGIKDDRNTESGNDWAIQYKTRVDALNNANNFHAYAFSEEESSDHLF